MLQTETLWKTSGMQNGFNNVFTKCARVCGYVWLVVSVSFRNNQKSKIIQQVYLYSAYTPEKSTFGDWHFKLCKKHTHTHTYTHATVIDIALLQD